MIAYPNPPFHEDALKDRLWNVLKDFKTNFFNEKGTKKVVLQFNEVLARLKAMHDHATKNVLKHR
jgi:hypothetical protein